MKAEDPRATPTRRARPIGVLLLLATLAVAAATTSNAAAQNDVAAAAALYQEGKKLAKAGQFEAACPKFEASYQLDEQLGTLMNLADCFDNLHKVATAWARWSDALEWAKRVDAKDRVKFIEGRLKETEAKLPKVTIRVTNPVPALSIHRGEVVVEEPMWGVALPVDPGPLEVTVVRGDKVLERRAVEAKLAEVTVVDLDLAAIERRHGVVGPPPAPPVPPPPSPEPASEPYDPTHRNVGLIVGAVGLTGVLVAAGLEIAALVKKGQAEEPDACVNKFCSPEGLADAETAATFAEVGQWVGIASLAVLAVGVTVFLTAPAEDDDADATARISPWVGPDGAGVSVGGSF